MGLDIVAFEKAYLTEPHEYVDDDCYDAGHVRARLPHPSMVVTFHGLEDGRCYSTAGRTVRFRAGSYSGYNRFREALCRAALGVEPDEVWNDPTAHANEPFFELINFADNEGTISRDACRDLLGDFVDGYRTVRAKLDEEDQESYDRWMAAFAVAAHNGLVALR